MFVIMLVVVILAPVKRTNFRPNLEKSNSANIHDYSFYCVVVLQYHQLYEISKTVHMLFQWNKRYATSDKTPYYFAMMMMECLTPLDRDHDFSPYEFWSSAFRLGHQTLISLSQGNISTQVTGNCTVSFIKINLQIHQSWKALTSLVRKPAELC